MIFGQVRLISAPILHDSVHIVNIAIATVTTTRKFITKLPQQPYINLFKTKSLHNLLKTNIMLQNIPPDAARMQFLYCFKNMLVSLSFGQICLFKLICFTL